ncbi:hypothetical protein JCM17961_47420 [Endothiovibrio diazotrophicus]
MRYPMALGAAIACALGQTAWADARFDGEYLRIDQVATLNSGHFNDVVLRWDRDRFRFEQGDFSAGATDIGAAPGASFALTNGTLILPEVVVELGGTTHEVAANLKLQADGGFGIDYLATPSASAETLAQRLDSAAVQSDLEDLRQAFNVVGLSAAVVTPGEVVWSQGFGSADLARNIPMTANTPMRIGSVSKAVLGVALAKGFAEGGIAPQTTINSVLPYAVTNPNAPATEITLRHLIDHSSGLSDGLIYECSYTLVDEPQTPFYEATGQIPAGTCRHPFSADTSLFLEQFTATGVSGYPAAANFNRFAPGEGSEYSNVGAALAAEVFALSQGQAINDIMRERLFDPLGMVNTGYAATDFSRFEQASQHYWTPGGQAEALPAYTYPTFADGGLRSSAYDLARLLAALAGGGELQGTRILTEPGVAMLFGDAEAPIYWQADGDFILMSGGDPGVATFVVLHRERGIGVVVLINTVDAEGEQDALVAVVNYLLGIALEDGGQ